MRRWQLSVLAAVAALGLQACDQSPPVTTVQPPQASLPDDTVLRAPEEANAPQAAAPAPAADGTAPQVAEAPVVPPAQAPAAPPAEAPPGQTNVMGAQPADPNAPQQPAGAAAPAAQAPAGQGSAAMTELWQFLPPAGGAGSQAAPAPNAAAPAQNSATPQEKVSAAELPAVRNPGDPQGAQLLAQRPLAVPVASIAPTSLRDNFEQSRGSRTHEAIDIMAPRGTPVVAVDDGRVAKLFTSKPGGLTVYQFDPQQRLAYYYAHLQGYAPGLREGMDLKRGDLIGYVGTSGNSDPNAPHLHFAVFKLGSPPKWWQGEAVNPWPALSRAAPASLVASR